MKQITLLITDEQKKRLREIADKKEIRMSEQIRRAIDMFFKEQQKVE